MEGVERYDLDGLGILVVTAESGVSITHPEHGVGLIEPDIYIERIDREYDYSAQAARRSMD